MNIYNYKDIINQARLGYASLPTLFLYNPEDKIQQPVELEDKYIFSYFCSKNRKFFNYLGRDLRKNYFTTLSREGFEIYKEDMWKEFDNYQTNNKPRYRERHGLVKTKILTKEEFIAAMNVEYEKIEQGTLWELYRANRKVKGLSYMCSKYNLDFEKFVSEIPEEKK